MTPGYVNQLKSHRQLFLVALLSLADLYALPRRSASALSTKMDR